MLEQRKRRETGSFSFSSIAGGGATFGASSGFLPSAFNHFLYANLSSALISLILLFLLSPSHCFSPYISAYFFASSYKVFPSNGVRHCNAKLSQGPRGGIYTAPMRPIKELLKGRDMGHSNGKPFAPTALACALCLDG